LTKSGQKRINMATTVKISKLEQFQHENQTWSRTIDFYKQENNFLKTRLSEVVDQKSGKDFLATAEQFQNKFIIKDEFIDELNHDVNAQSRMLKEYQVHDQSLTNEKLIKRQDKLRNEIEYLEKDFARLKNEFNKCLAAVL
jgi:hypothetical protein